MERLLLRRGDVPAVVPPVVVPPPVHVCLLHRGHESKDGRHGAGLQEGVSSQTNWKEPRIPEANTLTVLSCFLPLVSGDQQRRTPDMYRGGDHQSGVCRHSEAHGLCCVL